MSNPQLSATGDSADEDKDINVAIEKLGELVDAIEGHVLWTPPNPNKALFFMWDFVQRSRHMLRTAPEVFEQRGAAAANEQVSDVAGRSIFTKILMQDTTGKFSIMVGQDPNNPLDFGETIIEKAEAVIQSCPMRFLQG
ncbi:MAG: hypothetical protein M4579_004811 [Chaenotheca gracillima]|nr:MAG: hypothetical protein M4579_004811 [Chaenotheca gracillima]